VTGRRAGSLAGRLADALCRIDGVTESDSVFKDDLAFWVNGTEIAHFESENAIDVRLTRAGIRARRAALRADPRVTLRSGSSDWLTAELGSARDLELVVGLVEAAAAAHRPADGAPGRPPPAGPELARRRRFH
jgi:Family of unknown function (DUF5519)